MAGAAPSVAELEAQLKVEEARRQAIKKALEQKQAEERAAKLKAAEKRQLTEAEREEMRRVFDEFDKDKSGSVEASELGQTAARLGIELTAEEVAASMKDLDTDADGKLSFEEFTTWWSSSKKLGGNKGVKLGIMKAKLRAQMARDAATARMKAVSTSELSSRIIESQADIAIGGTGEFKAGLSAHLTVLPLSPALFQAEGKALVAKLLAEKKISGEPDFFDKPKESLRNVEGPITLVAKVICDVDPAAADKVDAAVQKYMDYRDKQWPVKADKDDVADARPPPLMVITKPDSDEKQIAIILLLRQGGPFQEMEGALNQALGCDDEGPKVSSQPEKIFESVAVSFENEVNPGQWFADSTARAPDLFRRARLLQHTKVSRSLLEVIQKAAYAGNAGALIDDDSYSNNKFKMAAAMMLGIAMAGSMKVKARLTSPALAAARTARGLSVQHRARVEKAIQTEEIKKTPELEKALAQGALESVWLDMVGESLGPTSSYLKEKVRQKVGEGCGRSRGSAGATDADKYDGLLAPIVAVITAPTQVQVLTGMACATLHLKGCEFLKSFLPADSAAGSTWAEAARAALEKQEERGEKVSERFEEMISNSKLEELKALGDDDDYRPAELGPRQLCFAGLKGSGKTCLVHMLRTGLPLTEPQPTVAFSTHQLPRSRKLPYSQCYTTMEYWNAEGQFSGVPEHMLEPSCDVARALVWVVDSSKPIDAAQQKGILENLMEKLEIAHGCSENNLLIIVAAKSDAAASGVTPESLLEQLRTPQMEQMKDRVGCCATNAKDVDAAEAVIQTIAKIENKLEAVRGEGDDDDECGDDDERGSASSGGSELHL